MNQKELEDYKRKMDILAEQEKSLMNDAATMRKTRENFENDLISEITRLRAVLRKIRRISETYERNYATPYDAMVAIELKVQSTLGEEK